MKRAKTWLDRIQNYNHMGGREGRDIEQRRRDERRKEGRRERAVGKEREFLVSNLSQLDPNL